MKFSSRPDWDKYFIEMLDAVAARATCDRGRTACIITSGDPDNRILTTGYVGSLPNEPHCDDKGHVYETRMHLLPGETYEEGHQRFLDGDASVYTQHCIRTVHPDTSSILLAAKYGISVDGGTMYSTMVPCTYCAKNIIMSGIKRVVAKYSYQTVTETQKMFERAAIEFTLINKKMNYDPKKVK